MKIETPLMNVSGMHRLARMTFFSVVCFSAVALRPVASHAVELPRLVSKTLVAQSTTPGVPVWLQTWYTQGQGEEMVAVRSSLVASDISEDSQRRFSSDNGATWSEWETYPQLKEQTPEGVHRQYAQPGWVDPVNGRMLTMVLDGVLPNDDPITGYTQWSLDYRVSTDGGRTSILDQHVIQTGDYTEQHPVEGVTIGQNAILMGASNNLPLRTQRGPASQQGRLLVPVQISQSAAGHFDAAVLVGSWNDETGNDLSISWNISQRVVIDAAQSSRGLLEPALAEMSDGRILMVMRGSNEGISAPGRKWFSVSEDGGLHWTDAHPWTYSDGTDFFSPSSCSQFIEHSNGKYYWIGNISPNQTSGNDPRYPLVIGEVDPNSLLLKKDTIVAIDTLGPTEDPSLQLSNFLAYEDRATHEIVINATRFFTNPKWQGDAYTYRVAVHAPEPHAWALLSTGALAFWGFGRRWRHLGN